MLHNKHEDDNNNLKRRRKNEANKNKKNGETDWSPAVLRVGVRIILRTFPRSGS